MMAFESLAELVSMGSHGPYVWTAWGATVESALRLDFALLAALTVLTTLLVVLGNLAADVGYRLVDPRVGECDG